MSKQYIIIAFACAFAAVMLSGCVQSPSNYKTYVINASTTKITYDQCTCMLCTNSSGNFYTAAYFTTGLESGSCFFANNCSRAYIYEYLTESKKNFVRDFLIGQGGSYTEYEESNLRCNLQEGYVVKMLYGKGRPPFYNQKKYFGIYDTSEADTVECALSKGAIPIYIIYTKGTYYGAEWIQDFMKNTVKDRYSTEPVFIAPEALFEKNTLNEIVVQIDAIYGGCDVKVEKGGCIRIDPQSGDCLEKETRYVRGCKVAIYPKQDTDAMIFDTLDEMSRAYPKQMEKVSAVILTLNVDKQGYNCDGGQAIANITNRSRYVLNKYGKPSFLLFSIDKSCRQDASSISLEFYRAIPFMRMTGIFGAAYSQYFDYDENPLNNNINAYSMATSGPGGTSLAPGMDDWIRLCKYYNEPPYKREPVIFQSNGVNITTACDFLSTYNMTTLGADEEVLNNISNYSIAPANVKSGPIDYEVCIPEIAFGSIEDVAKQWKGWDSFTVPGMKPEQKDGGGKASSNNISGQVQQPVDYSTMCWEYYPDAELNAERCGLSRHLLRAFRKLGVQFTKCDDWYDVEDELSNAGLVSKADISPTKGYERALGIVAFMYVLKQDNPAVYNEMLNNKSDLRNTININYLYTICDGVKIQNRDGSVRTVHSDRPCKVLKAYSEYVDNCKIGRLIERIRQQTELQQKKP